MASPDEVIILQTTVATVSLGIAAQFVAERFRLPAILPLLLLGIGAGASAFGLGWVQPDVYGEALEVFIHLGVAVILFEGGLSLDLHRLAKVGGAVRNLLSIGVAITAVGCAAAAHYTLQIPWSTAALFGAIVTVTGPTVVAPLLRHMVAPRQVKTVLLSEGLIIDPIGVVLAYLVLQWIERAGVPFKEMAGELVILALAGGAVGFLGGALARFVARRRMVSGELRNLVVLALVLVAYLVAEYQAHQSGILAAVVMGITMSGSDIPDLMPLKAFKEQLTTLVISVLFILLSAQLDVSAMTALGWRGAVVVALVILLVRPLSVLASVWSPELGPKERILLGMVAPRGIVAAAFASLAARQLERAGIDGAATLEGLVYLVILVTGAWATLMAVVLPHVLGYRRDPARRLTVLVGASPLSEYLAQMLRERGRITAVIDSSRRKLDALEAQAKGLRAYLGDARNASAYEDVGVEEDTMVLALTPNDELNLLVAEMVRHEFGVEHPVVALQQPAAEFGIKRHAYVDLLAGRELDLPRWIRLLEGRKARFLTLDLSIEGAEEEIRETLREDSRDSLLICGWRGSLPVFAKVEENLGSFETVTMLLRQGDQLERLEPLTLAISERGEEASPGEAVAADEGEAKADSAAG